MELEGPIRADLQAAVEAAARVGIRRQELVGIASIEERLCYATAALIEGDDGEREAAERDIENLARLARMLRIHHQHPEGWSREPDARGRDARTIWRP